MRALVTGVCGFVGRHLVQHLVACGDEVLGTDLQGRSFPSEESGLEIDTVQFDISDHNASSKIISEYKPEVVYHLAGIAFVPEAEDNFDRALQINVGGTNNIIRTCHLLHLGTTIVFVSSAEVYGKFRSEDLPLNESTPVRPANSYSLTKVMGELVAERYSQAGYVRSVIIRPFNHAGPGQDKRFVVPNFASQLASIAKGEAPPCIRVGNLEAQRDFSDVRDIVRGYRLAAEKGAGIYNMGSGVPVSIQSILDTLIEISGLKVTIERDPARMRPAEVPVKYGSYEKARQELGWEPEIDMRATLEAVYQYCLKSHG